MKMVKKMRGFVAIVSATALACTPLLLSPTGAGASGAQAASRAALPQLTAKVTQKGITVRGTAGLRAGRVHLTVKGPGTVEFVTFDPGYTADDFVSDVNKCAGEVQRQGVEASTGQHHDHRRGDRRHRDDRVPQGRHLRAVLHR